MKSFVSQGKTILDAIDKALIIAEFPQNFTIKILEHGVKSLFWWQNKAAIILFFYEITEVLVDNNKKKLKKNYSKEDAFINKKITNHLDEAEYTSVIKSEKNIHYSDNNQLKKPIVNKNKLKADSLGNKTIKENQVDSKKNDISHKHNNYNEPQSLLGAILQNKTVSTNNSVHKNKKTYNSADKPVYSNEEQKNYVLKEWEKEHIVFVENWMNELNKNFNLSHLPIKMNAIGETLFVKIEDCNDCNFISKKHLFSSIVIVLYENLKSRFIEFDNKYYKIIIE